MCRCEPVTFSENGNVFFFIRDCVVFHFAYRGTAYLNEAGLLVIEVRKQNLSLWGR